MFVRTPDLLEGQRDAPDRPQRRRKLLGLSTSALYQVTSIPGSESASGPLPLCTPANAQACELLSSLAELPGYLELLSISRQRHGSLSDPCLLSVCRGVIDKQPQTIGYRLLRSIQDSPFVSSISASRSHRSNISRLSKCRKDQSSSPEGHTISWRKSPAAPVSPLDQQTDG